MTERARKRMDFWDLYFQHGTAVYNFLVWYVGNREDAEDLTGTIFLKANEQFSMLADPNKATAWLWAITRNAAKNFLRDRKQVTSLAELPELSAPGAFAENGHRTIRLRSALSNLPTDDREIIVLREYQGFSYAEIAQLLNTTVPAVKSRLFRARENLRGQYFKTE